MSLRFAPTARAGLAAAALALTLTAPARADVRTEARSHFRRGMELIVEGQLDEGVAELEAAYQILPHPNVLYNIGRAYAEAGRYSEALEYFERYLASDPPDRDEVAGFVAAIETRLAEQSRAEQRAAAAAAAAAETPAAASTAAGPGGPGAAALATADEIAALRDAAGQVAALAEATDSAALRQRAARLRELAAHLEAAAAASPTGEAPATEVAEAVAETTQAPMPAQPVADDRATEGMALGQTQTAVYEEEVVSASRYAQSPLDAPNSTTIITRQDIRLTGITHVGELLRRVAGVQVMAATPADTNIGIRGFNQLLSPRVLALINGRSIYVDPLGITFWNNLPIGVEDIERIEVIRGPASALYGANGFSGVVNIITRDPGDASETEIVAGGGNGSAARVYLGTSGRGRGLSYRLSTSYYQYDNYSLTVDPRRVDYQHPVANPNLAQQAATARAHLRYRFTPETALNLEGGLNYIAQQHIVGPATFKDLYMEGPMSYAMGQLQSGWGGLRVFWNRLNATADNIAPNPAPNDILWNTVDVEGNFARSFDTGSVNHNLVLGASYRRKSIEWNFIDGRREENHYAVFFQDALRLSELVRLVAGFRMDRHPLLEKPVWSPRAAFVFRPTDGQAIRVSGSSAFRTQTFLESYIQNNIATPVSLVGALGLGSVPGNQLRGLPVLKPERIYSAEIGYTNSASEYLTFEASVYYNRVLDLVRLVPAALPFTLGDYNTIPQIANFDPSVNRFTYGTAGYDNDPTKYDVLGGEVGFRAYPAQGLDVYTNFATNLTYANVDGTRTRSKATPVAQVNAGFQYRSRFGLDVAGDVFYVSDTTWSDQVATTEGVELVNTPLEGYYLVNARLGYRLLDDALEIGIVGYNITNAQRRQYPSGQALTTRVMGTVSYRF